MELFEETLDFLPICPSGANLPPKTCQMAIFPKDASLPIGRFCFAETRKILNLANLQELMKEELENKAFMLFRSMFVKSNKSNSRFLVNCVSDSLERKVRPLRSIMRNKT